eukprot:TRINITY_DN240_c6_g2_i8.p1 TRINITY_DN240_c6_g2~~TRINITY_DN240_c6_g2_i8.p1  ORF type:complete len:2079 (-),score=522.95 TRINITY_DN240_c6_g2_i8:19-5433(-)
MARRALFSVTTSNSKGESCAGHAVLVLRLEKLLQGDAEAASEPYTKSELKQKEREKFEADAAVARNRLTHYHQILGWAYLPLFVEDFTAPGQFRVNKGEKTFGTIFRHIAGDTPFLETMFDKTSSKKLKTLQGCCTLEVSEICTAECWPCGGDGGQVDAPPVSRIPHCYNSCLIQIQPYSPTSPSKPSDLLVRRVEEFTQLEEDTTATPHTNLYNNLYLYPISANFKSLTSSSSSHAIVVRVQLMENDDNVNQPALFAFFSKGGHLGGNETKRDCAYLSVSHQDKHQCCYDELKLQLPTVLTPNHLILFTFLRVSLKPPSAAASRKSASAAALGDATETVGYAFMHIVQDIIIHTEEMLQLPIATALCPRYTQAQHEKLLQWIDGKKPLFKVRARLSSSIYPANRVLYNFFMSQEPSVSSQMRNSALTQLPRLRVSWLVQFFPVIMQQLFRLIADHPSAQPPRRQRESTPVMAQSAYPTQEQSAESMEADSGAVPAARVSASEASLRHVQHAQRESCVEGQWLATAFSTLLNVLQRIEQRLPLESPRLFLSYLHYAMECDIHEELCSMWLSALTSPYVQNTHVTEPSCHFSWFLFYAIFKSLTLRLHNMGILGVDEMRKDAIGEHFKSNVEQLVVVMATRFQSYMLKNEVIKPLSLFLCNLLSVVDRGWVMTLVKKFVVLLEPQEEIEVVRHKLDIINTVMAYEHILPLSLPLLSEDPSPQQLSPPLAERTLSASPAAAASDERPSAATSDSESPSPTPTPTPTPARAHPPATHRQRDSLCFPISYTVATARKRQHVMVDLLLVLVDHYTQSSNIDICCMAINTLRDTILRFEHDDRYNRNKHALHHIANMFIPLLDIVCLHQSSLLARLAQLSCRNLLASFLWVITSVESAALVTWWKNRNEATHESFFAALHSCADCFQYVESDRQFRELFEKDAPHGELSSAPVSVAQQYRASLSVLPSALSPPPTPAMPPPTPLQPPPTPSSRLSFPLAASAVPASLPLLSASASCIPSGSSSYATAPLISSALAVGMNASSGLGSPPSVAIRNFLRLVPSGASWLSWPRLYNPSVEAHLTECVHAAVLSICETYLCEVFIPTIAAKSSHGLLHSQGSSPSLSASGHGGNPGGLVVLDRVVGIYALLLRSKLSPRVVQYLYACLRALVHRVPDLLFRQRTNYCSLLCERALRHCAAEEELLRSHAAALLYLLLKKNQEATGKNCFRVKICCTIGLSSIAGNQELHTESHLARALATISDYNQENLCRTPAVKGSPTVRFAANAEGHNASSMDQAEYEKWLQTAPLETMAKGASSGRGNVSPVNKNLKLSVRIKRAQSVRQSMANLRFSPPSPPTSSVRPPASSPLQAAAFPTLGSEQRCCVCDQCIVPGQATAEVRLSSGAVVHQSCLRCDQCHVPLSAVDYHTAHGRFYCAAHFRLLAASFATDETAVEKRPEAGTPPPVAKRFTEFGKQVADLLERLQLILYDCRNLNKFKNDPEMHADLCHRIAHSYKSAPILRVQWLRNLCDQQCRHGNYAEAAFCVIHMCAYISEYLFVRDVLQRERTWATVLEHLGLLGKYAVHFEHLAASPNDVASYDRDDLKRLIREKAGVDDVEDLYKIMDYLQKLTIDPPPDANYVLPRGCVDFQRVSKNTQEEVLSEEATPADEEGVADSPDFSAVGLVALLHHAVTLLEKAHYYESQHEMLKLLMPVFESQHQYKEMAEALIALGKAYDSVAHEGEKDSRMLGVYYRVAFSGSALQDDADLNGKEFIYKEPKLTRLAELQERLKHQFGQTFQASSVNIVRDGKVPLIS